MPSSRDDFHALTLRMSGEVVYRPQAVAPKLMPEWHRR